MTRNGKIARLPHEIREQLNERLQNSEPGQTLLAWLNGLAEVREVLEAQFEGVPISKQNLSEWRQGGYRDWLRHEELYGLVGQLTEQAGELNAAAEDEEVSDWLGVVLAAELASSAKTLLAEVTDPKERWQRLRELLQELAQVRRADHRAARLEIERERWQEESRRLEEEKIEREIREAKDRALAPLWAKQMEGTLAEVFGGGEMGEKAARLVTHINYIIPNRVMPNVDALFPSGQAESNPVKPSQTESNQNKPDEHT